MHVGVIGVIVIVVFRRLEIRWLSLE